MTINTKFNLKDTIFISELKCKGQVLSIYVGDSGIQYNIRYFKDNSPVTCYFYEEEISVRQENKDIGFSQKTV